MQDPFSCWQELTATAVIGTDRRPGLPSPPPGALATLIGRLDATEPATTLLDGAAAAALYTRAGALPPLTGAEVVPPCPEDDRLPCSLRSARHLVALLGDAQRAVLPEWLEALAASGQRPPDEHLPALLELARADRSLRRAVAVVGGQRVAWLAGLNPDWAFAAVGGGAAMCDEAALAELWQTSPRSGRLALLETLRYERPAFARRLIESTWVSEKSDDRAAFVNALRPGLTLEDEPFLEAALDDRGKEVRANAAGLLASLSDSGLAGRMAARALALVRVSGGQLPTIEVSLPEVCDAALRRDGIEPKPPRGTGERVWWLSQIVARTPPAVWCEAWSRSPDAVLGARMAKEWRGPLLKAWSAAALAYGDRAWAATLAELAIRNLEPAPIDELLQSLPAAQREPLLVQLLEQGRDPLGGNHRALPTLREAGGPWSPTLARAVIAALARRVHCCAGSICLGSAGAASAREAARAPSARSGASSGIQASTGR